MNLSPKLNPINILIIDDHPADIRLMRNILESEGVDIISYDVRNGMETLAFLHQKGQYRNVPLPDLIILELDLNCMDGREVLLELNKSDQLSRIPVIVLTYSRDKKDILAAYELNANCYIFKPFDQQQFIRAVDSIKDFWLTHVKFSKE